MKKYYHLNSEEKMFEEGMQPEGWELGYSPSRKAKQTNSAIGRIPWNKNKHTNENVNKKLYHLGDEEKFFSLNDMIPEGWILGASNKRKENISTSTTGRVAWNKDQTKETNESVAKYTENNTHRNKFKAGDANEAKRLDVRQKISKSNTGKKHSEETKLHLSEIRKGVKLTEETKQKIYETKKKNDTFNTSTPEQKLFEYLKYTYGNDNVIHLYKDPRYSNDKGYQYECDFYIPSEDLFIELNAHWTHYKEPFNPKNSDHIDILNKWIEKSKISKFYKIAVNVWTVRDVEKLNCATENHLNYKVIYYTELKNLVNCWKTSLNSIVNETISSQAFSNENEGSETIENIVNNENY